MTGRTAIVHLIVPRTHRHAGRRACRRSMTAIAVAGVLNTSAVVGIAMIGKIGAVASEAVTRADQADSARGGNRPQGARCCVVT